MNPRNRFTLNPRWGWTILAIVAVVWGLTDVRRRARIDADNPLVHKTDFTVYTEAGAAFFDGREPYEVTNPRGWHYLYPPLFAMLVAPLALVDSQSQALVWYAISVAACLGCYRECRRILVAFDYVATFPIWITWLAVATLALPVLNCLQRGQVGVVIVYLLMLGARLAFTSRSLSGVLLAGVVLALPIAIKLTPLMPVGFLLIEFAILAFYAWRTSDGQRAIEMTSRSTPAKFALWRTIALGGGQALGLLLFLIVVPGMAVGQRQNIAHLQTWVERVAANENVGDDNDFNTRSKRNQSLTNAVERFGNFAAYSSGRGPDDRLVDMPGKALVAMPMERAEVRTAIKAASGALVLLLLVSAWQVGRRDDSLGLIALFGLACAATLLVSPLSWGHHYVMLLPAAVFVPLWHSHRSNDTAARWLAGSLCGLVLAHYLMMDIAGRLGVLGLGTTVWYVVAVGSIAWRRAAAIKISFDNQQPPREFEKQPQPLRRVA